MQYTLPDGTVIDLENISEISDIKDYGEDEHTIGESILCFTIRMHSGHSIRVSRNYHFNEWFDLFKELKAIRMDLMDKWEKSKADKQA